MPHCRGAIIPDDHQESHVEDSLEKIAAEVRVCPRCPLSKSRTKAVPGEGPATAEIMFIGEGPGFHEDRTGRPFVGAAGQFLDELLALAGLKREEVFITNIVKCRPPGNRDPLPAEIDACQPYLDRQIAVIQPKVIVTLGRYSMARYLSGAKISAIHGQAKRIGGQWVVAMYHPAAALHQPALKRQVEDDFRKLPLIIAQARQDTGAEPPEMPEQLSLF